MHHKNMSYFEILDLPTDVRIGYIDFISNENMKKDENLKKIQNTPSKEKSLTNPNIK